MTRIKHPCFRYFDHTLYINDNNNKKKKKENHVNSGNIEENLTKALNDLGISRKERLLNPNKPSKMSPKALFWSCPLYNF